MLTTLGTNQKEKVLCVSFRIAKIQYACELEVAAVLLKVSTHINSSDDILNNTHQKLNRHL